MALARAYRGGWVRRSAMSRTSMRFRERPASKLLGTSQILWRDSAPVCWWTPAPPALPV
jgi:hypothetical protein